MQHTNKIEDENYYNRETQIKDMVPKIVDLLEQLRT